MIDSGNQIIKNTVELVDQWSIWLLALLALIYLGTKVKTKESSYVVGVMSLGIIIIFNPFCAEIICNYFFPANRYFRLLWILPIFFIIAFAGAELSKKGGEILILCILIIILSGSCIFTEDNFQVADNIYKIPQEAIEICIFFQSTEEYKMENFKVSVDPQISSYIRQYDADIMLHFGREPGVGTTSIYDRAAFQQLILEDYTMIDTVEVVSAISRDECKYAAYEIGKVDKEIMQKGGYNFVQTIGQYEIFKNVR